MAITSYSTEMTPSIAGQLAEMGALPSIDSRVNAEASAEVPFGYAVVQGSAVKDALLPSADTDVFVGILAHSHAYDPENDLGTDGVKSDRELNIVARGRVWVVVGGAVSVGDRGYVAYTDDTADAPGQIMGEDHAGETLDTSAQIRFLTAASNAGDLALAEIDIMNEQGASTAAPSA